MYQISTNTGLPDGGRGALPHALSPAAVPGGSHVQRPGTMLDHTSCSESWKTLSSCEGSCACISAMHVRGFSRLLLRATSTAQIYLAAASVPLLPCALSARALGPKPARFLLSTAVRSSTVSSFADPCSLKHATLRTLSNPDSAQVTASRIQLCSLAGVAGGGTGAGGGGGRGGSSGGQEAAEADPDSPRPGMGKRHASWATMEGIADSFASRLVPFRLAKRANWSCCTHKAACIILCCRYR